MTVTMLQDQDLKEVFGPSAIVVLKKDTHPTVTKRLGDWLLAKKVAVPYEAPVMDTESPLVDAKGNPIVYKSENKK